MAALRIHVSFQTDQSRRTRAAASGTRQPRRDCGTRQSGRIFRTALHSGEIRIRNPALASRQAERANVALLANHSDSESNCTPDAEQKKKRTLDSRTRF